MARTVPCPDTQSHMAHTYTDSDNQRGSTCAVFHCPGLNPTSVRALVHGLLAELGETS